MYDTYCIHLFYFNLILSLALITSMLSFIHSLTISSIQLTTNIVVLYKCLFNIINCTVYHPCSCVLVSGGSHTTLS